MSQHKVESIISILESRCDLKKTKAPYLENFHIINNYENHKVTNAWEVHKNNKSFILCLVNYTISFQRLNKITFFTSTNEPDDFFFGLIIGSKDFGKTLIRPETLFDKISELFKPVELDFAEHKKFSSKYYLLSLDPEKARKQVSFELMEKLASHKNLSVEFNGKKCLLRFHEKVNQQNAMNLTKLCLDLTHLI